jgi:hypothetical protein
MRVKLVAAAAASLVLIPAEATADPSTEGRKAKASTSTSAAAGKLWRGKTRQGKRVSIRTGADGLVQRVRIRWRSRCSDGTKLTGATGFRRPFDAADSRSFLDEGSYRVGVKGPGTSIDTGHIRGTLTRNGPWRGVFRIRTESRRDGRVVARCRLRGVRWTARVA